MVSEHCETKLEITMPALVQNPEIFENEIKQIQITLRKNKASIYIYEYVEINEM
jgi:hypothetical protein